MQTSMLSHDLHAEFPELADKIHALKTGNQHFARLFEQYGALDKDIVKSEEGLAPMDDLALENLKKNRLKLKDELYRMLTAA
ncbi:MAG: GTP-binding protein [Candidatus Accumulibacter sp.]|nr:GTP-binding protein [Accumulibacter sp.]MBA4093209.1 GTP-binding protein [Accumulibacter sp.]